MVSYNTSIIPVHQCIQRHYYIATHQEQPRLPNIGNIIKQKPQFKICLLYTSDAADDC